MEWNGMDGWMGERVVGEMRGSARGVTEVRRGARRGPPVRTPSGRPESGTNEIMQAGARGGGLPPHWSGSREGGVV